MSIKKSHLLMILVFIGLYSCRKEESTFDREEALEKDTATLVFKTSYVSHNLQDLTVQIELVTFNKDQSKTNYSGLDFESDGLSSDYNVNFSGANSKTYTPKNSYNTALVLDLSQRNVYQNHELGVYLRRFFEIADSLPNRNVALSSFESVENHDTRFHSEQPGFIFGNSWRYSTRTMYELIGRQVLTGSTPTMLFFKDRIIDAIDTMVVEVGASIEKSLVLVVSAGGFAGENEADMNDIIAKANANNVHINLIMEYGGASYQRLAMETGGFLSYVADELDVTGTNENELDKSPLKNALLNLDDLLTNNITVHEISMTVSKKNLDVWMSGEIVSIHYIYDQKRRTVQLRIP